MTMIVFFTDNAEGRAALAWARENRAEDELHVVVAGGDVPSRPELSPREVGDPILRQLAADGVSHRIHPVAADPAEQALELAYTLDPRLLVVGIRGRRPTMKFLLGSNAQHLLMTAACPVVCVKPR